MPVGSVPDAPAQAQGQAAAPSSAQPVEAAPVPPEAVPAADEPQGSTLSMQHTPADGKVAGQHALPVYLVTLYTSCMFHLVSCVCFCASRCDASYPTQPFAHRLLSVQVIVVVAATPVCCMYPVLLL